MSSTLPPQQVRGGLGTGGGFEYQLQDLQGRDATELGGAMLGLIVQATGRVIVSGVGKSGLIEVPVKDAVMRRRLVVTYRQNSYRSPLAMRVVQADGQNVQPVHAGEIQIGVAETYDVIVQPEADRAYTLMCESMDRSGFGRATLAPRMGMAAAAPHSAPPRPSPPAKTPCRRTTTNASSSGWC